MGYISLTLAYRGIRNEQQFTEDATISDPVCFVARVFDIPPTGQRFMMPAPTGFVKFPFTDHNLLLSPLNGKLIKVIGSTAREIESVRAAEEGAIQKQQRRQADLAKATDFMEWKATLAANIMGIAGNPQEFLTSPEEGEVLEDRLRRRRRFGRLAPRNFAASNTGKSRARLELCIGTGLIPRISCYHEEAYAIRDGCCIECKRNFLLDWYVFTVGHVDFVLRMTRDLHSLDSSTERHDEVVALEDGHLLLSQAYENGSWARVDGPLQQAVEVMLVHLDWNYPDDLVLNDAEDGVIEDIDSFFFALDILRGIDGDDGGDERLRE